MRLKRFWFHYNKPASRSAGLNILTLHWGGTCYLVNDIVCNRPVETHHQNRQPHCIMRGFAEMVDLTDRGKGYLGGGILAVIK